VLDALEFDGPALVCCYTTCQPEHGVADNMATDQARLAVDTRAFPLLTYDPRRGNSIREHLSLQGNPAVTEDWWSNPKTGKQVDFIDFARSEGRFSKHFDKHGNPGPTLLRARDDRLENWRLLQELAGLRTATTPGKPARAAQGDVMGMGKTFVIGAMVKYNDGTDWINGTVESLEPAVLKLEDDSVIRTSLDILQAGAAAGLIVRR
jgi:hypothetical protein